MVRVVLFSPIEKLYSFIINLMFLKPDLHIVVMVVSTVANMFLTLFQAILIHFDYNITSFTPNISDLPAFLYKLISKEHALVIKEFPDWIEL